MPHRRNSANLTLAVIGFTLCIASLAALAVGVIQYRTTADTLRNAISLRFDAILSERKDDLATWLRSVEGDLAILASDPSTETAIRSLASAWGRIDGDPTAELQRIFITENPNPVGQKQLLSNVVGEGAYGTLHGTLHPFFKGFLDHKGYYDLFLFDTDGNLIYSVFKEPDFATNFVDGPYADSGLGEAFRAGLAASPGVVSYIDFAPYAPSAGAMAAFVSIPVHDLSGRLVGVLAAQMPIDRMSAIVASEDGLDPTTDVYLVGEDGRARSASRFPDRHGLLDPLPQPEHVRLAFDGVEEVDFDAVSPTGAPVVAMAKLVEAVGVRWAIVMEEDSASVWAPLVDVRNSVLIVLPFIAVMAILGGVVLLRRITAPLRRVAAAITDIAGRRYDAPLEDVTREDEFGAMARSLCDFRQRLAAAEAAEAERERRRVEISDVIARLTRGLEDLSGGRLDQMIEQAFPAEYESLRTDFNRALDQLSQTMRSVIDTARNVSTGSQEIRTGTVELAERTERQAATLEETSRALGDLTRSVERSEAGAREAETLTRTALGEVEEGSGVVGKAVGAMSEIESASRQVSRIVGLIEDIAFQTNLLALNAGVEAARAGEAGRGFAVVASEVRSLAQKSSEAAKEIESLIRTSSAKVAEGVSLVRAAGDSLSGIVTRVTATADVVAEIARQSHAQSSSLDLVNDAVTDLESVTRQNAAMVEQTSSATAVLSGRASSLTDLVAGFRVARNGEPDEVRDRAA